MANKTKKDTEFIEHAKDDARNAMKMAKARFSEAQSQAKKYIKDNPAKAAFIAAGIGAAIGAATVALIRRGKKKEE